MSQEIHIEIVPCVDTLLYAPVYLGIIGLAHRYEVPCPQDSSSISLAGDSGVLKLTYARPARDDKEVLTKLDKRDNTKACIGICDPITVIDSNYQQVGTSEKWRPKFQIVGVFIDRIALSVVTRKTPATPPSDGRQDKRHGEEYQRARALRRIIRHLKDDKLNSARILRDNDVDSRVVYEFWSKGRTTIYLAEHFLGISAKVNAKEAETAESYSPEFEGLDELLKGSADVAITHSPWSFKMEPEARQLEFLCRECFPAIQFPFSCMVIPANIDLELYKLALEQFVAAVFEGLIFVSRHPNQAVEFLTAWAHFFRDYGLKHPDLAQIAASCALSHFLKIGCYPENLMPQQTTWEYALAMDPIWEKRAAERAKSLNKTILWDDLAWDVVSKSMDHRFVQKLPSGEKCFKDLRLNVIKWSEQS